MNFDFSEDEEMIREMVRRFGTEFVLPHAEHWDSAGIPDEMYSKLGELGLLGMTLAGESGGSELGWLACVVAIEEMSKADAALGLALSYVNTTIAPVLAANSAPSLARILNGDLRCAFQCDGQDALNSSAGAALFSKVGTAYAYSESPDFGPASNALGLRGLNQCVVKSEGAKLGSEVQVATSLGVAALATGLAQAALEEGLSYSNERHQFGKPLSAFQATQFKLANMAVEINAGRLLTHRAALALEANSDQAEQLADEARLLSLNAALFASDEALQLHGGYGYTSEYRVERIYRDARYLLTFESQRFELQQRIAQAS